MPVMVVFRGIFGGKYLVAAQLRGEVSGHGVVEGRSGCS